MIDLLLTWLGGWPALLHISLSAPRLIKWTAMSSCNNDKVIIVQLNPMSAAGSLCRVGLQHEEEYCRCHFEHQYQLHSEASCQQDVYYHVLQSKINNLFSIKITDTWSQQKQLISYSPHSLMHLFTWCNSVHPIWSTWPIMAFCFSRASLTLISSPIIAAW